VDDDEDRSSARGRRDSQTIPKGSGGPNKPSLTFHQRRDSGSSHSGSGKNDPSNLPRPSFTVTRSRSPAPQMASGYGSFRTSSPLHHSRHKYWINRQPIFPSVFQISIRLPFSQTVRKLSMDSSKAGEVILLLVSLGYVTGKLSTFETEYWASIGYYPYLSIVLLLILYDRTFHRHCFIVLVYNLEALFQYKTNNTSYITASANIEIALTSFV
jgi:hypothetical protein